MTSIIFKDILGGIAVLLGVLGYTFYIRGIIQGKVKPHVFTWFVWGLLTAIAFAAQINKGGGAGSWVTGITALFSFAFAIVGLHKSSRALIAKKDWLFLVSALMTIPVWYITGSPLWSVILITIIDFVAFIPTIRKAYFHPQTENGWAYFLAGIKFTISLFALGSFTWTTALYPASLIIANMGFVFMLLWQKNVKTED